VFRETLTISFFPNLQPTSKVVSLVQIKIQVLFGWLVLWRDPITHHQPIALIIVCSCGNYLTLQNLHEWLKHLKSTTQSTRVCYYIIHSRSVRIINMHTCFILIRLVAIYSDNQCKDHRWFELENWKHILLLDMIIHRWLVDTAGCLGKLRTVLWSVATSYPTMGTHLSLSISSGILAARRLTDPKRAHGVDRWMFAAIRWMECGGQPTSLNPIMYMFW